MGGGTWWNSTSTVVQLHVVCVGERGLPWRGTREGRARLVDPELREEDGAAGTADVLLVVAGTDEIAGAAGAGAAGAGAAATTSVEAAAGCLQRLLRVSPCVVRRCRRHRRCFPEATPAGGGWRPQFHGGAAGTEG